MSSSSSHSFDARGFVFGVFILTVACLLILGLRFGEVFADEYYVKDIEEATIRTDIQILELKAKRLKRSYGEMRALEELHEFETTLSTRSIGTASIEILSQAHTRLIAADLTNMRLYLFEKGYATTTIPILSKGKRGSRWETPTGLYKVETKEEDHFSSIGEVHMPKSMQFFGNFFIHGWPYYPDGSPVAVGYSGGCIRLSTEDAAIVFDFAEQGTPLFVWEETATTTEIAINPGTVPSLSASAYLLAEIGTGTVYAEKNSELPLPLYDLTTLLTALVGNETIHFDRALTIDALDYELASTTLSSIKEPNTFTVGDLLYPLLMESNGIVAHTLARYFGQSTFVRWMNDKARAIGMEHTKIVAPSGQAPTNVTSASDLFQLARYIHNSQSFILNITRLTTKTITDDNDSTHDIMNSNEFAGDPQYRGGKGGAVQNASSSALALFEIPIDNKKVTIAIVVLDSRDEKGDIQTLLTWFKHASLQQQISID